MTFIDLFAGIGGFRLALERLGMKCVFSSEIDKYAQQTYEANFGEKPHGDITKIEAKDIPPFDIICAGFPCQPFSVAGKRKGIEDERGNLFDEIIRIIEYHKPKVIFLENVRGLVSSKVIYDYISKLHNQDYDTVWKVLKASDYGLPTLRPRVYIIAFNNDYFFNTEFQWPLPVPLKFTMSDVLKAKCDRDIGFTIRKGGSGGNINDRHNWQTYRIGSIGKGRQGERVYSPEGIGITLMANGGGKGGNSGLYEIEGEVRKLTVDEMKMMMGFPEGFKFPVSKTQAMKQIGNSVAIDVIEAIGKQIIKVIKK
jgi:DNA (cytosine-5)-methyltransferase 1